MTWLAQCSATRHTAHRPFPLPSGPWVMAQSWVDLLFAHWPLDPAVVRPHVAPQVDLDLFDGRAYISVTPFEVRGTRLRATPPPPVLSRFPETNVRTYVTVGGRPGIWFFSLDAASALAVRGARAGYRLPYFDARMRIAREDGWVDYSSERVGGTDAPARFAARYRPTGGARHAQDGTLEAWLVERYRLYTVDGRGRVLACDIHHRPWTLEDAEAEIRVNTMTAPAGIPLHVAPVAQFARRQDVLFWPPRDVGPAA